MAPTAAMHASDAFSSMVSIDHVPRWHETSDLWDQDVYVNVLLNWGDVLGPSRGSFYWRGVRDVDGPGQPLHFSDPFRSAYDSYRDDWFSHLYHAYFDLRGQHGRGLARLGRQFIHEGQPFHFDGIRLDTGEGTKGLRTSVFGGVPVHYFEESNAGDWLAGVGVEVQPWRRGRIGLVYAHVADDSRLIGLPVTSEADDMLILRAGSKLGDWGNAHLRYTTVDFRTFDMLFRAAGALQNGDVRFSLSYYAQPEELSEFTMDVSPYHLVQGTSYPFSRVDLSASKGFPAPYSPNGWRFRVAARGSLRRLSSSADEGLYNRDYDLLWLGVEIESPADTSGPERSGPIGSEPGRFSLRAGQAWWWSSSGDVGAFDAEIRWEPSPSLRLGAGTTYSLYRYELSTLAEQSDVRETYLRLRWRSSQRNEIRFRYSWESETRENEFGDRVREQVHKARLGCTIRF